ncbi:MAG: hypothetical protein ACKOAD_03860 [Gammaproteobacteria bacterium]
MGLYIVLNKIEENNEFSKYEFKLDSEESEDFGVVEIRKSDGNVREIKEHPCDQAGIFFERAAWALLRHWKKREFPQKTCWA